MADGQAEESGGQCAVSGAVIESCRNCRHHSEDMRPRIVGEADSGAGMDLLEFADDSATYFLCKAKAGPYAGREVGLEPVRCESYAPPRTVASEELDALMARMSNRTRGGR